jgi:ribosome biogenesis GTPase
MEMPDLGFNTWLQLKLEEADRPGYDVARVTAVNKDSYLVQNEKGEVFAEITGRLLFSAESGSDLPVVGDWAFVQYYNSNTFAIIDDLLPRKSVLRRKAAGKMIDYQMLASNIDVAFVIQSCDFDFNLRRLERYLVMINDGNIEPVLLLSKSDLISKEVLEQRISEIRNGNIDCEVIAYSSVTGLGLDRIRHMLEPGATYCLLGSSGVGKTTLLNHLIGRDIYKTNTVRVKDGRGRHTTARRQLIVLHGGAMLIDTPGMRELGIIGVSNGLDESFSDIINRSEECRFNDCTHTSEAGCAVLTAVTSGELSNERYYSYMKLIKESQYHEMSYLEKRRKDRKFGQFIKSAMKQHKKR